MPTLPPLPPLPSKSSIPSLSALGDLSDVPGPVLALVGAGDVAAEVATNAAKELQAKLAAVDTSTLDIRDREVRIDVSALDFSKLDLAKLDPRNIDIAKIDPRRIDAAALTTTGLLWAAKGQEAYESLVARGESVVSKARSSEWSEPTDGAVVAQPPAAPAPVKKAAAKATKKTAAPKVDPEA